MYRLNKTLPSRLLREAFLLLIPGLIMVPAVSAQVDPSQPAQSHAPANDKLAETLNALRTGNLAETDFNLLITRGAVQTIPDLKKQFALTEDQAKKGRIASALIRLGDKDSTWWDYLAEKGEEAVSSDTPSVVDYDSNGKMIPGPSAKFLA